MNGTIKRWLRGTPVALIAALAAALAFASVGCIAEQGDSDPDESDVEELDEENVAEVEQQLDPVVGGSASPSTPKEGGIVLPGADAMIGEEGADPQPQPWRAAAEDDEDGDPSPNPAPDPFSHTMLGTPSGGHNLD